MTPQVGQQVKVIFRNGTVVEGIVNVWENNTVELKSLDDKSVLIISHPAEDIMMIKVSLEPEEPPFKMVDKGTHMETPDGRFQIAKKIDINDAWRDAVNETDHLDPEQIKTLAELRMELNKREKEIIALKLREHRPSRSPQIGPYHYPSAVAGKPEKAPNGNSRPSKK